MEDNHFNITYHGKRDKLNVREQNFEINGEVKIRIQYNAKKNQSTIITREGKNEKLKEVKDGLIFLQARTNQGSLQYSY